MMEFKIDGTDFGIDPARSEFRIVEEDGGTCVDIEVRGDPERFAVVSSDKASPWQIYLYPPKFYLYQFPAHLNPETGIATAAVALDDLNEYEAAIYMLEHNDIEDVVVKLRPDTSLEIAGMVYLSGKRLSFSILWTLGK